MTHRQAGLGTFGVPPYSTIRAYSHGRAMDLVRRLRAAGTGGAIRLPKGLLDELQLAPGDDVVLTIRGRKLIVRKLPAPAEPAIDTSPSILAWLEAPRD